MTEFEELCEALPLTRNWGDPLTPAFMEEIRDYYKAQAEQDAKRYRMLRVAPLMSDMRPCVTAIYRVGGYRDEHKAMMGEQLDAECDKYIG
jgi:hypothetical protein